MVEAFLAEMETEEEGGAAPPVSEKAATVEVLTGGAIPGSRAESAGSLDDEAPGPSWGVFIHFGAICKRHNMSHRRMPVAKRPPSVPFIVLFICQPCSKA